MARSQLGEPLLRRLRTLTKMIDNMARYPDYQPGNLTVGLALALREVFIMAGLPLDTIDPKTWQVGDTFDANAIIKFAKVLDAALPEKYQDPKERRKALEGTIHSCIIAAIFAESRGDQIILMRVVPRMLKDALLWVKDDTTGNEGYSVSDLFNGFGEKPYFDARILPNHLKWVLEFIIQPESRLKAK